MDIPHTNYVNFLAGNQLHRLSWKRSETQFMNLLAASETSQWIVFKQGQPLVTTSTENRFKGLAYLHYNQVRDYLGKTDVFGHGQNPGNIAADIAPHLECARIYGPRIVFLGILLEGNPKPSAVKQLLESNSIHGRPTYYCFDIGEEERAGALIASLSKNDTGSNAAQSYDFIEPRAATASFPPFDAGIFAEARSMIDWNCRNLFCPACGSPTYSIWAGWKLSCSSLLPWNNLQSAACPSGRGLQNYVHPRTDPVVIVAVVHPNGESILLGRNKKFPPTFYSTLAGFLEPGESIEEAVKREVLEESGISVTSVTFHSAQPWPYPANLMIGCYALAENADIECQDGELEDARFFTKKEIRDILAHPQGTTLRGASSTNQHSGATDSNPTKFRVPPLSAIAGVLISEWAHDRVSPRKSNL